MSSTSTHVILGGNGVVGRETARALLGRGIEPVSAGRRPSTVAGVRSVTADLLDPAAVGRVLEGAEVAYLTAGLPYSTTVWRTEWPVLLEHVIEAAIAHGTHLVYFDNVYAYGPVDGPMTERSPIRPTSGKGHVRADALRALDAGVERGLLRTVARSADFYGPGATTSVLNTFGIDRIAAGKDGTWLLDADQPHSLTYTPDIGATLAVIGTDPAARGHVWHLPTAAAQTGREYLAAAGGGRAKVMGMTTLRIGAVFSSAARETLEMAYQYTAPYVFDASAFEAAFGVAPTPISEGIAATRAAAQPA